MSGSDGEEGRRERNTITTSITAITTVIGEKDTVAMDDDGALAATAVKQRLDDARFPRSVNRRKHDDSRRDDIARTLCDTNDHEAEKTRVFPGKTRVKDPDLAKVCFSSMLLIDDPAPIYNEIIIAMRG